MLLRLPKITLPAVFAVLCASAWGGPSGGDFEIVNSTIDGGGGVSTGGDFKVTGTIGQHDATGFSVGADFSLSGGFWGGGILLDLLFKDSFEEVVLVIPFLDQRSAEQPSRI